MPAVNYKEIFTDTVSACAEKLCGGRVYTKDISVLVKQYQALLHIVGYLIEFVLFTFKLPELFFYLTVLTVYSVKQGRKLLVSVIFKGVFKV